MDTALFASDGLDEKQGSVAFLHPACCWRLCMYLASIAYSDVDSRTEGRHGGLPLRGYKRSDSHCAGLLMIYFRIRFNSFSLRTMCSQ